MCIQSYYNQQNREEEIELDLLKEIKEVGVEAWNEEVTKQTESGTKEESEKED